MTLEELEIIVTTKVEEALKEFQKILPTIKQTMKQAQEAFSKVDTKTMTSKLHQAVQFMKKKMQDFKKSTENNEVAIKVTNKEAQKQISQIQKQIDSLQEKINARQMKLNIINPQIDKIVEDTRNNVVPDGISKNDKSMDTVVNNALSSNKDFTSLNSQAQKLYTEIEMYNKQLSEAKSKMEELGRQTSKTAITQSKLSSFFNAFKQKIDQVKPSISNIGNSFKTLPKITQNITNNIKGMNKSIKQGLRHVIRYAMALFSLRGIYSVLSNSAQSWLSSQNAGAKQLSANIDYMKYAMGSAFAPVIQWVTGLIYNLMKAIQSVIYALFRVNIFAKASASSYSSMAGSAKKAKEETKQLAGVHDEINNIQDNGNSDSGSGGGVTPNMDLSGLDSKLSPFAQKLYDFFKPLKDSWDIYGPQVLLAFKNAFNGIGQAVSTMWSSVETIFTNGTIYLIIANILNSIGQIGNAWANAWNNGNNGTEIVQGIANMINDITEAILKLVSSTGFQSFLKGIVSSFSGLVQFLEPVVSGVTEMSEKILEIVMSAIGDLLQKIGEALQAIGQNETAVEILKAVGSAIAIIVGAIVLWNIAQVVLNGLMGFFAIITSPITWIILAIVAAITSIILIIKNWGAISEWFGNLWQNISNSISNIWNNILNTAKNIFNGIKDTISNVFNAVKNTISNIWNGIINTISNVWNTIVSKVSQGVQGAWNAITSVFGNVANWFKDKFSQAWQAVKNVFSTGGKIFDGIKDGILNGLKSIVNAIIGGINKVISIPFNGINSALKAIKSVNIMGLQPFSWIKTISVPQIPRLAKGGIIDSPTIAMMGEYAGAKSNPEIVTPQNIMRETMEDVFSEYLGNNDQPISLNLTVKVGDKKLGQILLEDLRDKTRRTGKDIEALVGG